MEKLIKPNWIKVKSLNDASYQNMTRILKVYNLHTICQSANCPNIGECWKTGTATFLLMGDTCTRNCRFCSVKSGDPNGILDQDEPLNIAKACKELSLKYIVLTSVDRDDLQDGGARHFAKIIKTIRKYNPDSLIEALIPDFNANKNSIKMTLESNPHVLGHNIETVEKLSPIIRDKKANYRKSLKVLKLIKELNPKIITKSSIQVGLGETEFDVKKTILDLKENSVDIITIGQYLQPTQKQIPVAEYIHPEKFEDYKNFAKSLNFKFVLSGPFVRSSYKASEYIN